VAARSFHGTYLIADTERGTLALAAQPTQSQRVTLVPAFDPARQRAVVDRVASPVPTEKTVWAFWDQGADRMTAFYR
jgi:hypothetical protein